MKLIPKLVGCSLVAFLFVQEAFAAKDVTKIGVTTIVKNKVLGEPPKMVQRKLKTGLEVYFNEKVETRRKLFTLSTHLPNPTRLPWKLSQRDPN